MSNRTIQLMIDIIIVFIVIVIIFKYFEHTDYPTSSNHQP